MTQPTQPVSVTAQSIEALREIVATLKELEAPYTVNVYISTVPPSRIQPNPRKVSEVTTDDSLF